MARGYSKGRGGHIGNLVSQRFINADPATITRGGATIQAASSTCAVTSTFTSSGTLTLECATTIIEYLVVAGGGATELACSIAVAEAADKIKGVEQYAVRAFADALEEIPLCLAENSGYSPIEYVSGVREQQIKESSSFIGVDASHKGTNNMFEQGIFESAASKKHQLELAC